MPLRVRSCRAPLLLLALFRLPPRRPVALLDLADARTDDSHFGNRLHRPLGWLASGERCRPAAELALEPGGRTHDQEVRRSVASVCEGVWRPTECEGDLAG